MKELFSGYYKPTQADFRQLWKKCTFVLDTSVLLNLYRYSDSARGDLLKLLTSVSERLWLPHQVALEYQRNRLTVIADQHGKFTELRKLLDHSETKLRDSIEGLQLKKRHSSIDPDKFLAKMTDTFSSFREELKTLELSQLSISDDDNIRTAIDVLFKQKVGPPPKDQKSLEELYAEGEKRYRALIPPGYKDSAKDKTSSSDEYMYGGIHYKRKFGDLLIWKQIIGHAKQTKISHLIFVTDDEKEDWLYKVECNGEKTVGPRPELIEEIGRDSGIRNFHIYNSERFMEFAQEHLNIKLKEESIKEVKEVASQSQHKHRLIVEVNKLEGAEDLVFRLRQLGLYATFYESRFGDPNSSEKQEGIWVGSRVPVDMVCTVLRTSMAHWPFLKYVYVSGDNGSTPPERVNYRIFVGGATSAAERNNLRPWTNEDFRNLNEDLSLEQLHSYIRSFYEA